MIGFTECVGHKEADLRNLSVLAARDADKFAAGLRAIAAQDAQEDEAEEAI
jgi:hypothetical protein